MAATSRGGRPAATRTEATVTALLAALGAGDDPAPLLAAAVTFTVMTTGEVTRGRTEVIALLTHLHQHAFAVTPEVRNLIERGERAMVEIEFAGTHVGEFAGIRPAGAAVRVPYAAAFDLAAGVIAAIRVYLPLDVLVQQIRAGGPRPSREATPPTTGTASRDRER